VEIANRTANGELIDLVNEYEQDVPMIQDGIWRQANGSTSHKTTKYAAVPSASVRALYQGVSPTALQTIPTEEHMCMIEDQVEIDEAELRHVPDPMQFRYEEDLAHMEGMKQKFGAEFFYGARNTEPRDIQGLSNRYNALSDANVWGCGGTGSDLCSLWFVVWGLRTFHMVYPMSGIQTAIQRVDEGRMRLTDASSNHYFGYVTKFTFEFGIVARRDDAVQRICNIESSIAGGTNLIDIDLMIQAKNKLPTTKGAVIYCNDTVKSQLEIAAKDKPNVVHYTEDPFGKPVLNFFDIPIKVCDALVDTESAVS
jgi:hypothetical protein